MIEPNNAPTIQRNALLDALKALKITQEQFSKLLKEDSYSCGYKDGFSDALIAMAQIIGIEK